MISESMLEDLGLVVVGVIAEKSRNRIPLSTVLAGRGLSQGKLRLSGRRGKGGLRMQAGN